MRLTPKLIYEDEQILVVDKPAGLLTHADGYSKVPSLVDWLLDYHPMLAGVGESSQLDSGELISRPGLVHRLDRGTSGLLVVAKTDISYHLLKQSFRTRKVEKTYRLLVHGVIKESTGSIRAMIGRSRQDPRRRAARASSATGERAWREAQTDYAVIKLFAAHTYLEAYPRTGRTHQLRVHFHSIGHPILGDRLYNPTDPPSLLIGRPALHAYNLRLPAEFAALSNRLFLAPLPPDFFAALAFVD